MAQNTGLKAACLAAGLTTAWTASAHALVAVATDPIQVVATPTNALTHVYFLYGTNNYGSLNATATSMPDLSAGLNVVNIRAVRPSFGNTGTFYSVLGLYADGLVTIGLNSGTASSAITGSLTFPQITGADEATIATDLSTNNITALDSFFANLTVQNDAIPFNTFTDIPSTGSLVNFSSATAGGTVSAVIAVPEPCSLVLIGTAATGLLSLRRRRQS